jgi:hypothetical protein
MLYPIELRALGRIITRRSFDSENSSGHDSCGRLGLSNSFRREANPTGDRGSGDLVFSHLRMAEQVLQVTPDEVARNGAHLRITSARGLLKAPLAYLQQL